MSFRYNFKRSQVHRDHIEILIIFGDTTMKSITKVWILFWIYNDSTITLVSWMNYLLGLMETLVMRQLWNTVIEEVYRPVSTCLSTWVVRKRSTRWLDANLSHLAVLLCITVGMRRVTGITLKNLLKYYCSQVYWRQRDKTRGRGWGTARSWQALTTKYLFFHVFQRR